MADNKKETKSRYPKSIRVIAMVGIYYYTDCGTDDIPAGSRIV